LRVSKDQRYFGCLRILHALRCLVSWIWYFCFPVQLVAQKVKTLFCVL
jgi:hypothetical protein